LSRVDAIVQNRCMATLRFAQRWTTDRRRLEGLCNGDPGELQELNFGAGDSQRGGTTARMVRGESVRVVYEPRTSAINAACGGLRQLRGCGQSWQRAECARPRRHRLWRLRVGRVCDSSLRGRKRGTA